jgi:hypothetical protein
MKMWLIEVNKGPCFAHSTDVTADLIPKFMEDMAKVLIDKNTEDIGKLELVLDMPFIKEPNEIRTNEEFTITCKKLQGSKKK